MSDLEEQKSGMSRRTVAKAMAWSVPAVALAIPAPAYASSGETPTFVQGVACKLPGQSCPTEFGYIFPITVENNTGKTIVIESATIDQISGVDFNLALVGATPPFGTPITHGETVQLNFLATSTNSANAVFSARLSVEWGHFVGDPDHEILVFDYNVDGTKPCKNCNEA